MAAQHSLKPERQPHRRATEWPAAYGARGRNGPVDAKARAAQGFSHPDPQERPEQALGMKLHCRFQKVDDCCICSEGLLDGL